MDTCESCANESVTSSWTVLPFSILSLHKHIFSDLSSYFSSTYRYHLKHQDSNRLGTSIESTMANSSPKPPLLRLPTELHLEIIEYLQITYHSSCNPIDILSLLNLHLTSRVFYSLLAAPTFSDLHIYKHSPFVREMGLYTCNYCVRLRHGSCFSRRQIKSPRGHRGKDSGKRVCLDCAAAPVLEVRRARREEEA